MKNAFNKTFQLTRNRKLILLNFSLIAVISALVGLITDSMFGATLACIISSIVLRIVFGWNNQRDFGDNKTIVAANGRTFSLTHKRIVEGVMWVSAVGCWFLGVSFKSPYVSDFLPHIIGLFSFQFIVKSMLFILDLPIATFNVDQRKVPTPQTGPFSQEAITSPLYSHFACNNYHHRHRR